MKMPDPRYAETFVLLADTTSDTFDLVDFLHGLTSRCVELLDVSASGLFLARPGGSLFLAASSSSHTGFGRPEKMSSVTRTMLPPHGWSVVVWKRRTPPPLSSVPRPRGRVLGAH